MKIYKFKGHRNICGSRVREARMRLNLSQENLAARLQMEGIIIERDTISRIEIGARFVSDFEILALSRILKVSVSYLLNLE